MLAVWAALAAVCLSLAVPPRAIAARSEDAVMEAFQAPALIAERRFANHVKGLQWMGMSNKGEWGNPDGLPISLYELEYPGGSGTVFLFSGGVWVGAVKNGVPIVSTATDGNNGTGEYGGLDFATPADQQTDTRSVGWLEKTKDAVTDAAVLDAFRAGRYLGKGVKEKDDDGDWNVEDDVNGDGKPSADFDGRPGIDDDGDGAIDEEILNGIDDDGDGLIDEDVGSIDEAWVMANAEVLDYLCDDGTRITAGDANGDGVFDYDPETHIDEDPAGDISNDFLDNDHDGLFDMDDPDYDGDMVVESLDDDGDGLFDEDDLARAGQEFIVAYADTCERCVEDADTDGFTPLGVRVVQHTYQWSETYADDFILMDFEITNIGNSLLEGVCVGTFFDFDIGHVTQEGGARSEDDVTSYVDSLQLAIGGDNDGDNGLLEAQFFGVRVIQTPLPDVGATYRNFDRLTGGDPPDNAAKYELMASGARDPDNDTPGDWRFVLAFGPLGNLPPGQTLPVTVAIVNGFDMAQIVVNARQAKAMFDADFRGPSSPDSPVFTAQAVNRGATIVWKDNAEASVDPISQYMDFQGYSIWRSPEGLTWTRVATWDLPDTIGLNIGWPPPASTVEGFLYQYEDVGLANGFPYRYVVTAFDDGGNGDGINNPQWDERNSGVGVLESSRGVDLQQVVYPAVAAGAADDVSGVFVVPNPYIGSSRLEQVARTDEAGVRQYYKDIEFRGLPGECDIQIFTLSGDLVQEIHHDSGLSWYAWNLRTNRNQEIAAGIYVYRVSRGGNETVGKFIVVK